MGWTIFRAVDIDLIDQNHVFSFGHSMGPNPKTQVGSLRVDFWSILKHFLIFGEKPDFPKHAAKDPTWVFLFGPM